jgi:hypothetical protein
VVVFVGKNWHLCVVVFKCVSLRRRVWREKFTSLRGRVGRFHVLSMRAIDLSQKIPLTSLILEKIS